MKVRVVYKADKTVAIIRPGIKSRKINKTGAYTESEIDWYNRVMLKTMQRLKFQDLDYDDIDDSTLPSHTSRNAWEGTKATKIVVNSEKLEHITNEELITNEMNALNKTEKRTAAIDSLKQKGELSQNY